MTNMWNSLSDNLGKIGSEEGEIKLDDELPNLARITIELKKSHVQPPGDHYAITVGVYGILVHTAFFKRWEDAIECSNAIKLIIQALLADSITSNKE
jgi:hypothetical protein